MMKLPIQIVSVFLTMVLAACSSTDTNSMTTDSDTEQLELEVRNAEQAFATTMADRDFDAFMSFLAEDAVFFNGESPLRGKDKVAAAWKSFYEKADPPFSWQPQTVVVLDSGQLALSSGPVHDAKGKEVGRFNSIWRREADGVWKIVFDKGS
jgi:ketosteroid isomerase-like protein